VPHSKAKTLEEKDEGREQWEGGKDEIMAAPLKTLLAWCYS